MRKFFGLLVLWPLIAFAQQPSEAMLAHEQLLRDSAAEQQARERQVIDQHWLAQTAQAEAATRRLHDVCSHVEGEDLKKLCTEPLALNGSGHKRVETPAEMCAKVNEETRARWALCNGTKPPDDPFAKKEATPTESNKPDGK